jgi:hypothetical protein
MMLGVVLVLAMAIGLSLRWVEIGLRSVGHAQRGLLAEESMIAAVRIASIELSAIDALACEHWLGGTYPLNDLEIGVSCSVVEGRRFLRAEVGSRWLRAEVAPSLSAGERWRLVGWFWPG